MSLQALYVSQRGANGRVRFTYLGIKRAFQVTHVGILFCDNWSG